MDDFKEYIDINETDETDSVSEFDTELDTEEDTELELNRPSNSAVHDRKTGGWVQSTIIISAVIVGVVLLAAILCRLFAEKGVVKTDLLGNKTTTCWRYSASIPSATPDEPINADYYLFFEPNGKLRVQLDTVEYTGTYSYHRVDSKDDKKNAGKTYLEIGQTSLTLDGEHPLDGKYYFTKTGSVFDQKLKLTYFYDSSVVYEFDQKPYKAAKTEREGTFTGDESLYGSWKKTNELSSQSFVFKSNGEFVFTSKETDYFTNQISIVKQTGIFNCENGKLTLTAGTIYPSESSYQYTVSDGKLVLSYKMRNSQTGQDEDVNIVFDKQ